VAIVVCIALALIAPGMGCRMAGTCRRDRRAVNDSLRRVFRPRELRELDTHLEQVAVYELRRLEVSARHCVTGDVGYAEARRERHPWSIRYPARVAS
jgi:hypothetical protein